MLKVGQRVICIDNTDCEDRLNIGQAYTVLDIDSLLQVELLGVRGNYVQCRFRLVPETRYDFVENEQVYMFDVDDTLVMWNGDYQQPGEGRVAIQDPYDGATVFLIPNRRHVKLVRTMAGRKRFIVVWSAGGAQWARAVVEALGLSDVVNLIMTKPLGFVDDLPAKEILGQHIYLTSSEEE